MRTNRDPGVSPKKPAMDLISTERLSTRAPIPPWVRSEHSARYEFAARYVANLTVVDCACGVGLGTLHFAESGADHVYAFDASDFSIQQARANCVSDNVEFRVADALDLPLPSETADVFISLETIEHLQDAGSFLKEIVRLLRPDGLLICTTPNREMTNPGSGPDDAPLNPYHVREYSLSEFTALLAAYFASVAIHGQNPRRRWLDKAMTMTSRLLGRRVARRVNQALKLVRFISYDPSTAQVVQVAPDRAYEYMVAVCRK